MDRNLFLFMNFALRPIFKTFLSGPKKLDLSKKFGWSCFTPGEGHAIYDFFCLFLVMFPDQGLTQESIRQAVCSDITFSFIYLAHPRSVTGISWRKTSKYMPRGAVANMLVTSCSGKKSKMILCFRN